MNELIYFVKTQFQRSENGLVQVILLNSLSFFALLALKIVLVIAGYETAYAALYQSLALPASWTAYVSQPWALLTYSWVHVSFFSTLWGLLLLHILGKVVMHRLGSRRFVALYLLGGLAGGSFFLLLYNLSPYFQSTTTSLSGFAGGLYAIIVAAAMLAPQHSLSLLFFWGETLKLKYFVGFLILLTVANLVGADPATSIAHLGGALLGYVYVKYSKGYVWLHQHWTRFKKTPNHLKINAQRAPLAKEEDKVQEEDQATMDHILDKVATSGYESLTPTEKQQLFNAGK